MSVESSALNVERSAPKGAVFLSYASQDAEAAKRIADALRASGVEVWFDAEGGLEHGDEWDAKIRRQIKECVLFIAVISANTQAREEGYFRLEWDLAAERARTIASGVAFILPVVVDATREPDALVPDRFRTVQWTKLPGGSVPPEVLQRLLKLWSHRTGALKQSRGDSVAAGVAGPGASSDSAGPGSATPATAKRRALWPWFGLGLIALAAAYFVFKPRHSSEETARVGQAAQAAGVATAAQAPAGELARLRARIVPDRWQKGDFEAFSPVVDRLIKANPEDADAWAMRSILHSLQVVRLIDPGSKPLEEGRTAANHALRLEPGSPLGELALGLHLVAMVSRGGDPAACRAPLDRALAVLPPAPLTRYVELVSYWLGYDFEGTDRSARAWLAAEPEASFPAWILVGKAMHLRSVADAEKWAAQAVNDPDITGVRTLLNLTDVSYYLRADPVAARATLDRIPARFRTVARVAYWRWLMAMIEGKWDHALQELAQVPEPLLLDIAFNGPKAYLAGLAHQRAGRADAAVAQFRDAERILRDQLATDPENEALRVVLAATLACAGRADEARRELALIEPLVRGRAPNVYSGRLVVMLAHAHGALGENAAMAEWLRKLFTDPSNVPFCPASLRLDPRFRPYLDTPEVQALLREFAALDPTPATPATARPLASDEKSVAVLAFANLSSDKEQEYFSDGISEEVLNVLAKVPGLKVSARTSAFYFKGKQVPMAEIAQQLGVAYIVEGSVQRAGDRVKITAQLIKAADGFHVWSDSFTRDLKDIFAVQDEIAGLIAKNLELKIGVSAAAPTLDPEVLPLYYSALQAWNLRTLEGMDRAEDLLNQVLRRAPGFARGHAAMAMVWVIRGELRDSLSPFGLRDGSEAVKISAKVQQALQLDPNCAEAYAAQGLFCWDTWQLTKGIAALRQAIALNPNLAFAHQWLGRCLSNQGYLDEGLAELGKAAALDPLSPRILDNNGRALLLAGRPREAESFADRALALQPGSIQALAVKGSAQIDLGHKAAAVEIARALPSDRSLVSTSKVRILAAAGQLQEVEAMLPELTRTNHHMARISALVALGRKEEALAALDANWVTANRTDQLLFEPILDPIRGEPRFQKMLATLDLTEAHARAQAWRAAHPVGNLAANK